jgi:hypothetical protein
MDAPGIFVTTKELVIILLMVNTDPNTPDAVPPSWKKVDPFPVVFSCNVYSTNTGSVILVVFVNKPDPFGAPRIEVLSD